MKCLVTGGSGYFGSLLVRNLIIEGHSCSVLDVVDADDRPPDVEFFCGDIRDSDVVRAACRDRDVVFHNVAQVPLAKDKHLFHSVNVEGTETLLRACAGLGVGKVVYTSSSAVYGVPRSNPVTEDTEPNPGEAYGAAKLQAEKLCGDFRLRGSDITIIRPRTVLGHGRLGIFQVLFEWVRQGRNVPVLGGGENRYQFVHADDLARACILAAQRPGPAVFNCGTDRFGTMRQLLESLCRYAHTGSRVKSLPVLPATMAMRITGKLGLSPLAAYHALMYGREFYFDIALACRELGWQPRYSNEEMILQSYEWYLANRERVLASSGASRHRSAVNEGVLKALRWFL